jgi:hypothetical protein
MSSRLIYLHSARFHSSVSLNFVFELSFFSAAAVKNMWFTRDTLQQRAATEFMLLDDEAKLAALCVLVFFHVLEICNIVVHVVCCSFVTCLGSELPKLIVWRFVCFPTLTLKKICENLPQQNVCLTVGTGVCRFLKKRRA